MNDIKVRKGMKGRVQRKHEDKRYKKEKYKNEQYYKS